MNETSPDLPKPAQGADAPAQDRRRLLRAAATVAPLIATLPSGAAAQAVASTYQCVAKDKTASDNLPPTPPSTNTDFQVGAAPTDQWLRVTATRRLWTKSNGDVQTFSFPDSPNDWYREDTGQILNTQSYGYVEGNDQTVAVLRIYSQAAVVVGDLSNSCDPVNGNIGKNPPYSGCVFPIARRDEKNSDNMALTGSCMASFA